MRWFGYRCLPIVQPPSTSGVRVVTAASAQIPEVDEPRKSDARRPQTAAPGRAEESQSGSASEGSGESAGD